MLSDKTLLTQVLVNKAVHPLPGDWGQKAPNDEAWFSKDSPVQPSSIDLHVGYIYVPGTKGPCRMGGERNGHTSYELSPGHSVIVSTFERVTLSGQFGGLVFPPSRLSSKGILVANIGHIDPGHSGPLRFTIINMGARPVSFVREKDAVGTLMLFELDSESSRPLSTRFAGTGEKTRDEPNAEEIDALALYFAGIEERVREVALRQANRRVRNIAGGAFIVSLFVSVLLGYVGLMLTTGSSLAQKQFYLEEKLFDLSKENISLVNRLEQANRDIEDVRAKLNQNFSEIRGRADGRDRKLEADDLTEETSMPVTRTEN
ncbi:conserved protein [Tepidicaulis marinus]|uniref:Conserved protein n=2 Tax=Tepidicaulis marinus TaxID=1333998 RepID=A0A081BF96_9HYPH|nr:conserved protein [Tepidicaulis marinus]